MAKHWVIPDIHGCSKTLIELIEKQIKPDKTDVLYFLGDYINRGPDSKGVLDYLMKLAEPGTNSRFLMGNHEKYLLKAYKAEKALMNDSQLLKDREAIHAWLSHGGDQFLKSFGVSKLIEIPREYFKWVKSLQRFVFLKKHILVHAGLNFENEDPFQDRKAMLWIRNFSIEPKKINSRVIVHGHVPKQLKFIKQNLVNENALSIDLDNGVYVPNKKGFGNLLALELKSKKLLVQENLDH